MGKIAGITAILIACAALLCACSSNNTGAACQFTKGSTYCKTNIAELNVASDCNDHWCLSYQGGRPFCSNECTLSNSCPEGYRCLKQDFSPLDPSLKGIFFCIPKSSGACNVDDDCNPNCKLGLGDGGSTAGADAGCIQDYFCQSGYCQPNSCKS
jgi:hypothetical protein